MGENDPLWRQFRGSSSVEILGYFKIAKAPVYPEQIAAKLGVHVHRVPNPGWVGACRGDEKEAHIWLNQDAPLVHQRFTLAHELGHLLLHRLGTEFRDISTGILSSSREESEANAFAEALLMPRAEITNLVYLSELTIEQMAALFMVRPSVVATRLEHCRRGRSDL